MNKNVVATISHNEQKNVLKTKIQNNGYDGPDFGYQS